MPIENHQPTPPEQEATRTVVDALFMLWEKLPPAQQATTALILLDRTLNRETQPWIREELATRWLIPMDEVATAFPVVAIRHEDLAELQFGPDDLGQLDEEDLLEIAQTLRDHYVHDWFRDEVKNLVGERLAEKEGPAHRSSPDDRR